MADDDLNAGGNIVDLSKPAPTEPPTSAGEVKKKKKKRRPDTQQSVFESQPAKSFADAAHKVDAGASRTAEAQALIGAAMEEEDSGAPDGRSVFQSLPVQTSADTGHATGGSADCNVPDADGVFESRPSPSGADVAHNKAAGNHARDAEALILAAAELDENAAGGVFEKQPQQSAADIRHADSNSRHAAQAEAEIVAAADEDISRCSKSVFESKPQQSAADLRHSDSFQASDNAVVFESDPKPSQAHVGHGKAVQKVLENAGTAGVFESAPIKSTADAHHDETEVWGSEYETDESEDEVELPPTNLHAS
mmetsp:Transcript_27242/g.53247  ORF Transcript_27242/g.53247 Transcript_27242/m.53247 type:complete len:309 (-) Transcript_27242:35-961(-)